MVSALANPAFWNYWFSLGVVHLQWGLVGHLNEAASLDVVVFPLVLSCKPLFVMSWMRAHSAHVNEAGFLELMGVPLMVILHHILNTCMYNV